MATDDDVRLILDLHADALTTLPNVVGVGIVDAAPGGSAVAVYVREKVPESQLAEHEIVPKELRAEDVSAPTQVIEIGEIRR